MKFIPLILFVLLTGCSSLEFEIEMQLNPEEFPEIHCNYCRMA